MPPPTLGSSYLFPKGRDLGHIVPYYKWFSQPAGTRGYPELIPRAPGVKRLKTLGGAWLQVGWICNMSMVVERRQMDARIRQRTLVT